MFLKGNGVAALLFLAGLAVNSMAAAAFALAGAIVAVLTAHLFGAESELITGGLLGFSPVLTAIALGAVFYRPSWRVVVYAMVGTVFTVIVQAALNVALTPFAIPALTAPFVLVTWMFLLPRQCFEPASAATDDAATARTTLDLPTFFGERSTCADLLVSVVTRSDEARTSLDRRSQLLLAEGLSHGTPRDIARARTVDVACLSRVERTAGGPGGCAPGRCDFGRAASRPLDADLHGRGSSLRYAVVSDVPAWRVVRQAHGRQRFDHLDRAFSDRTVGNTPHDALGRACFGRGYLWRRQRLRCLFRAGPDGAGDVPGRGTSRAG